MSNPAPTASASAKPYCPIEWLKRHLTPYHLTVAAVLGGITAVFVVVIALLLLCALNFNVLGLVE